MANRSYRRRREAESPAPVFQEPSVRRWPHPIACAVPDLQDTGLYSVRCALACQTQLLTDIRALLTQTNTALSAGNALLEQIEVNTAGSSAEKKT